MMCVDVCDVCDVRDVRDVHDVGAGSLLVHLELVPDCVDQALSELDGRLELIRVVRRDVQVGGLAKPWEEGERGEEGEQLG